jgi:hypothetical protein
MIFWAPALLAIFVVMTNLAVGAITFLVVTLYSVWYFGLAAGIFSFLIALNSVKIRGFSLAPIFPGRAWSVFLFLLCIGSSLFYGVMHWEWSTSFADKLGFSWSQQSDSVYSCSISEGPFYSKKGGSFTIETSKGTSFRRGFLTGKKDIKKGRPTMVEVRLGDSVTGDCYWVPIGRISSSLEDPQASAGDDEGDDETKKQPGVVVLTPEEIVAQNEQRALNKGKTLLILPEYFQAHSRVILLEDLVIETNDPQNSTVLFFGGHRGFIGRGQTVTVPKGTVFRFGGTGPRVYIVSKGEHKIVSSLKLKKI